MIKKVFVFLTIFLFWIILEGKVSTEILIAGFFASLLTLILFRDLLFRFSFKKITFLGFIKKIFVTIFFIPVFFYEALISALKVSRHVFEKKPSFSPGIVKVKTKLESYIAITILANLITLTPGTLTIDFDGEENAYYIHWIDVKTQKEAESRREIIETFEEWLEVIFE